MWRLASILILGLGVTGAFAAGLGDAREAELTHMVLHDCGSCHGMRLKGGLGNALTPEDLDGVGAADLASIILNGVPDKPMPPWRGLISEQEAHWIADALKKGSIK